MATSLPQDMLKSELLNRLPLNLETAEEFGPITAVWVDTHAHRVKGFSCSSGLLGRQDRRFLWLQVASIGHDGIVIRVGEQPETLDDDLQDCLPLGDLELWSDHGDRVGQLTDYSFDTTTGNILHYRFIASPSGPLAPGLYALAPSAVISTGRRRMMVQAAAINVATLIDANVQRPPTPTVRPTFNSPIPFDRVPDPKRSWEATVETTRQAREQMAEQLEEGRQKLQAEAQNRFGNLLGDVKKRTRRLRNQLRETVTDVTAGLPSGQRLRDDTMPTIDVDAMELWAEEDDPKRPDQP